MDNRAAAIGLNDFEASDRPGRDDRERANFTTRGF